MKLVQCFSGGTGESPNDLSLYVFKYWPAGRCSNAAAAAQSQLLYLIYNRYIYFVFSSEQSHVSCFQCRVYNQIIIPYAQNVENIRQKQMNDNIYQILMLPKMHLLNVDFIY